MLQGEEGPPSLEYIQAKDLFPQKELVKEDDNLQVIIPSVLLSLSLKTTFFLNKLEQICGCHSPLTSISFVFCLSK